MRRPARAGWIVAAILLLTVGCGGGSSPAPPPGPILADVTVAQAFAMTQARAGDPTFAILDVRTPAEHAGGHLENATNLDVNSGTFDADVALLDRQDTYLVYCHAGSRSAQAASVMAGLGFVEVYNMLGGITAWTDAGYPTVP